LLGSARQLRKDPLGTYGRALKAYGAIARFRVGPPRLGFEFDAVFSPEGARRVLATDVARYRKDAPVFAEITRFLGEGLLTSEGDRWRRDRRIVQPLFTRRRIGAYVSAIAAAADDLVGSWKADAGAGRVVDLHESAMRYALDALGRAVLGDDVAGARPVLREALPLLSAHSVRRGLAIVRLPPSLPTPANRRAAQTQARIYALVDEIIARRRSGPRSGDDLLSLLLAARDPEGGAGIDDRGVRDQALVFLLGGHETTGSALAFTLQVLATHGDVQERARAEATSVLGDRPPTAGDIEALRYTAQVVDEALRLYPPGHTLVRTAVEDSRLLGHPVRKGRIVAISIWGIHHNASVWPEPERFDPDRFAVSDTDRDTTAHQGRYAHLPFGGGPRACIGAHLAMTELVIAVAAVLRAYRLRAVLETPILDVALTLRPRGALPCHVEVLAR
jgi:cytochrome P450